MRKIIAFFATLAVSAVCVAGGVIEISRSPTQTCAVNDTGVTFTNTFSGSFGYHLLEVDVWAWNTAQTNIVTEIVVKAVQTGSGVTNTLATLTNGVPADAISTNATAVLVLSETSSSIPSVFSSGDMIVLQCATSQTWSASVKRKQFLRQ